MNLFYPLKKISELDTQEVGFYAKEVSKLDGVVNLPFSLVISSQIFDEFIKFNNFQELISKSPSEKKEQIELFAKISDSFSNAKFPQRITEELKECFELVTLDTSNLSSLSDIGTKRSIIELKRSTTYEDKEFKSASTIYSKDDFILFLDIVKNLFVGLFTPAAISFRKENNISSFSTAIIISRLPDMYQCFESKFEKDSILIKSYIGFLDFEGSVTKDRFEVTSDFLKIEASNINKQETVAVFNLETNHPQIKAFMSTSASSQSATDNEILEIGRLTKRIAKELGKDNFSLRASRAKNSQPVIIDLNLYPEKIVPDETTTIKKNNDLTDDSGFQKEKNIDNSLEGFEFEIEDDFNSESTKKFIEEIKHFLSVHKTNKLKSNIDLVLRSLDNEISKESVLSALEICHELIKEI